MKTGAPYWLSFLKHPYNQALSVLTIGAAVVASFWYGFDVLALAGLGLAAAEIVGLAVVPDHPRFRAAADKYARSSDREAKRANLLRLIDANGGSAYLDRYERMRERVAALAKVAADTGNTLTQQEVEHLDDLTVEYLGMCLSDATIRRMTDSPAKATVNKQLRKIEQRMQSRKIDPQEAAELERARQGYLDVQARQQRLETRHSALQASLVAMPLRVEEIYQIVSTAPRAGELSMMVDESLAKLRADEQLGIDVESMLGIADPLELITADMKHEEQQARARQSLEMRQ